MAGGRHQDTYWKGWVAQPRSICQITRKFRVVIQEKKRCNLIQPPAGRRSEGVSQIVRESHAACLVGEIEEMEIAMGEELSWHDFLQVSPPIDLNKSLPAFPLQVCGQHGKARGML
jgi:hypothetical protein